MTVDTHKHFCGNAKSNRKEIVEKKTNNKYKYNLGFKTYFRKLFAMWVFVSERARASVCMYLRARATLTQICANQTPKFCLRKSAKTASVAAAKELPYNYCWYCLELDQKHTVRQLICEYRIGRN